MLIVDTGAALAAANEVLRRLHAEVLVLAAQLQRNVNCTTGWLSRRLTS